MISILGQQMKMPSSAASSAAAAAAGNEVDSTLGLSHGLGHANTCATPSNTTTKDNFDSYFSKLQTICTDSNMEEGKEGGKLSQQQQLGVSCSTASSGSAFSGSGMGGLLPLGSGNAMPPPPIPPSMMPTSI